MNTLDFEQPTTTDRALPYRRRATEAFERCKSALTFVIFVGIGLCALAVMRVAMALSTGDLLFIFSEIGILGIALVPTVIFLAAYFFVQALQYSRH